MLSQSVSNSHHFVGQYSHGQTFCALHICLLGGRRTMRGTPGREPLIPYQIFLTKYGIVYPLKRNMLTAKGQHFICPNNMGYIRYYRVILAFRGLFLLEKRVLQDMICCPFSVIKYPFKRIYYSI